MSSELVIPTRDAAFSSRVRASAVVSGAARSRLMRCAWGLAPVLAFALAAPVKAQSIAPSALAAASQSLSPSMVTPQSFEPSFKSKGGGIDIPATAGAATPKGGEQLSLRLGRVTIDGAFPELSAQNAILVARLQDKKVTIADLFAAANELEQAYARAGYVLVRVSVPPQRLVERGPVRIVVVDGFIEAVKTDGVPERFRRPVGERLEGLIGRRHVTLADLERALLIAGGLPGMKLKSALSRGQQLGGALLVVEGEDPLFSTTVTTDRRLPAVLGRWETSATIGINGALGHGEELYLSTTTGYGLDKYGFLTPPLRTVGVGAVVPMGEDGVVFNPEYTNSRTQPKPLPGSPPVIGQLNRFSMRGSYPVVEDRAQTFTLDSAIEVTDQLLFSPLFASDLSHDDYAALRVGASWQRLTPWGAPLLLHAQFSRGLGGRNASDAKAESVPLSRQGASPYFAKLNVDAHLLQALPDDFHLDVIGKGQWTFARPQLSSEQFSLDGPDAVSALPSGSLSVDAGATGRVEFGRTIALTGLPVPLTLSPYLFGAAGWGRIYLPTFVERSIVSGAAFGVGLKSDWSVSHIGSGNMAVEFARQYSDLVGERASYQLNLSVGGKF